MFNSGTFLRDKLPFAQVLYWTNWLESLENPNRKLMLPNIFPNEINKKKESFAEIEKEI